MQRGFKAIVRQLIREKPGLTAIEYARMALQRRLCGSDSNDPEWSLGTIAGFGRTAINER